MTISVIVPTHNRCSSLQRTIESIRNQDFRDFELIIVNDGSTDGTREFLDGLEPAFPVTSLHQSNLGPALARNAGISEAKGVFAAFTDDDCVVPRDWLTRLHRALQSGGIDIAGGGVRNTVGNIYADASQKITNHFVAELAKRDPATSFLTSNNVAYRLETLKRVGGFDARFSAAGGEERALHMKIIDGGGKSLFLLDCLVDHAHAFTLFGFLRQQFNYGRGSYLIYRVVGRELQKSPGAIPFPVYTSLFGKFFKEGILRGTALSMLYLIAQVMVMAGYVVQAAAPRSLKKIAAEGAR